MTLVRLNFIDTYLQYLSTYFCPGLYIYRQRGRFVQFFFSLSFLSFRTLAKFLIRRLSFFLLSLTRSVSAFRVLQTLPLRFYTFQPFVLFIPSSFHCRRASGGFLFACAYKFMGKNSREEAKLLNFLLVYRCLFIVFAYD